MSGFELGVVADDSHRGVGCRVPLWCKGGLETVLFNGVPEADGKTIPWGPGGGHCAKNQDSWRESRRVEESMEAFRWLRKAGAPPACILKYCSTFDSTPEGNIGPVADAVMEELGIPYTLLCPLLPVNGRTVRDGAQRERLPCMRSHMRNHP